METLTFILQLGLAVLVHFTFSGAVSIVVCFAVGLARPPVYWLILIMPAAAPTIIALVLTESILRDGDLPIMAGMGLLGVFVYGVFAGALGWVCGPVRLSISVKTGRG